MKRIRIILEIDVNVHDDASTGGLAVDALAAARQVVIDSPESMSEEKAQIANTWDVRRRSPERTYDEPTPNDAPDD